MKRSYALTTSLLGPSITIRPRSSQIASSQKRMTWSSACDTRSIEAPPSISLRMRAVDLLKKYASPAPRISSTIRISGSIAVAIANDEPCLHAERVRLERLVEEIGRAR